jgi:hypothetical protein
VPPSVDIDMFKDWKFNKEFLVGFLGAGCNKKVKVYPERYRITKLLNDKYKNDFFTADHPGWGYFKKDKDLVGEGFSKAINKCKMFISTAGRIGHCNPKYYEIMASGSFLLAGKHNYIKEVGLLKNGENCIIFNDDKELLQIIDYYLDNSEKIIPIVENGLETIKSYHSGIVRVNSLIKVLHERFN